MVSYLPVAGENISPDATAAETHRHLKVVSQKNIQVLQQAVGKMSDDERKIYKAVIDTPWRFKHQTRNNLEEKGYLHNLSNWKLHDNKIKFDREFTNGFTKKYIRNDDFVFFALEILHDNNFVSGNQHYIKDNGHYYFFDKDVVRNRFSGAYYGNQAYMLEENHSPIQRGYFTFTDQTVGAAKFYSDLHGSDPYAIKSRFPELCKQMENRKSVLFEVKNPETGQKFDEYRPLFSAQQMKPAMALMAVLFLRNPDSEEKIPDGTKRRLGPITHCTDEKFKAYVKDNISNPATVDMLIHAACEPEFHIPRMVSTHSYKKFDLAYNPRS